MQVRVIKTRPMIPPKDDLYALLDESLPKVLERSVVVVTSKVVAIHQGRCLPLKSIERDELIPHEADWYTTKDIVPGEHITFTRKNNVLIASAGIDKSNARDHLVLWPRDPMGAAKEIYEYVVQRDGVTEIGVVVTDSHIIMMRRGTLGVAIGWWGFNPIRDYRGKEDIFGRELVVQTANVADALAAAAVLEMGEGREQTPLAVISEIGEIDFSNKAEVIAGIPSFVIPMEEDLFLPMLTAVPWEKGQGGLSDEELEKLKTSE